MVVDAARIKRLVRRRIDGHRHQQPRGVWRRLHVQHPQGLQNDIAAVGKHFLESLGHLVTELQSLAIRPLLRSAVQVPVCRHDPRSGMGITARRQGSVRHRAGPWSFER